MKINKIILENYGLYRGLNIFDLSPKNNSSNKTPIILFGGRNGAGKTTFLNSIRLALYGKRSLGDRTTQGQYESFLVSKIHRNPNAAVQARSAKVAIEFSFVAQGELSCYYIERSWSNNRDKLSETLTILKDGFPLDQVDAAYWDSFVSDIIPERLSQLFFFDGEKIQEIADDIKGNAAIAEAIQTLLGLDLIDKLQADLKIYKSKEAKQYSNDIDKQEIVSLEKVIKRYETEQLKLTTKLSNLESEKDGIERAVEKLEERLRAKGADFANDRGKNQLEAKSLSHQIELLEQGLYKECSELFPLALCPSIANILDEQLIAEDKLNRQKVLSAEISKLKDEVSELINSFGSFSTNEDKSNLESLIADKFNQHTNIDTETIELLGLSQTESQVVRNSLKLAVEHSADKVLTLSNDLESQNRDLARVQNSMNQAPEDALLEDELNLIVYHNQQIGSLAQSIKATDLSLKSSAYQLGLAVREKEKLEDKQKEFEGFQKRSDLVENINTALAVYHKRLTETKIKTLRKEVVDCFNTITRKSGFVKDVSIDADSYEVTILNAKGASIPKEDLSSGEKQIFAISFLWALAKTSGRPLPVIIDTPLGRLDSEHRENLVKNYFPRASHQTILFSTDTEVDEELFSELSPHISHCYHLHFDKEKFMTTPKEEYFWQHEDK